MANAIAACAYREIRTGAYARVATADQNRSGGVCAHPKYSALEIPLSKSDVTASVTPRSNGAAAIRAQIQALLTSSATMTSSYHVDVGVSGANRLIVNRRTYQMIGRYCKIYHKAIWHNSLISILDLGVEALHSSRLIWWGFGLRGCAWRLVLWLKILSISHYLLCQSDVLSPCLTG